MSMDRLTQVGEGLVKRFDTRDPLEIAEDIGIEVLYCDNFGPLKGMYRVIKRNRFIFLNKDLNQRMTRIVCAHEIGHDQLHRYLAKGDGLQEFMLYDMTTKPEYEANIVASEILLDSNEVLDYIFDYHYSAEEIARCMGTDINLVALKIAHLNELGYQKMYAVLCGAASEAIDQLENIPLALPVCRSLQAALDKAEEIYLEAPYPHDCEDGGKVIEFKSDNKSHKQKM